jgi:DNA-binding NtrC family response regulator
MKGKKSCILVVDDEPGIREILSIMLESEGYAIELAESYDQAVDIIGSKNVDVVISDIMMPTTDGIELLRSIKRINPDIPVILITAYASLNSAVEALRLGAFDYITKPFQVDQVKFSILRALDMKNIRQENRLLKRKITDFEGLESFVGVSKEIKNIKEFVRRIAPTDCTVLITGDSGTGKEIIARAIHKLSSRANGPFVSINCAALPETLLESELFGYMKGAFTGANKNKEGLFAVAESGTFFLDEVGETSPAIQAKLLRILETFEFVPLGATAPIKVDIRLVAATNMKLKDMVDNKDFRTDLYYRLNVINIHIPPLSERSEDIIPISKSILEKIAFQKNEPSKELSEEVTKLLTRSVWEGNVRELENTLERAVILCTDSVIQTSHLPQQISKLSLKGETADFYDVPIMHSNNVLPLEEIEKAYIYWALANSSWNKSHVAEKLGIDLSTLYRKIERFGLKDIMPKKK